MSEFVSGRIYIAGAYRVGLGLVGRKWVQVVYLEAGDRLAVRKLPVALKGAFMPLKGYETPQKLARRLRRGRRRGQGTKSAWRVVEAALAAK